VKWLLQLFVLVITAMTCTAAAAQSASSSISIAVEGDKPVEVVLGPISSAHVIVYMHGLCGDPFAFSSWAKAVAKHATLISLRGDRRCKKNRSRYKWSYDHKKNDRRISKAIEAVETFRQAMVDSVKVTPLDGSHLTLLGYSQGAARAAQMAYRFPKRYRRVGLIASPAAPNATMLLKSERVLLVAGGWDVRKHIKGGLEKLKRAKIDARYLELPKARHGEYGPEALRVMGDGVAWLLAVKKLP
jgi:predicted esterase